MMEILSNSIHKWRRYPFLNAYKKDEKSVSELGALLWRRLTPQRNTAIWMHNYSPSRA